MSRRPLPRLVRRAAQVVLGLVGAAGAALLLGSFAASPASADPCPPAYAPPFTDVPVDHPFCTEIYVAKVHGAVAGNPDGSFQPTAPVRRGEVAAILANAATADEGGKLEVCASGPFVDVPADHHFCPHISAVAANGVMAGFLDGTFRPGDPITRGAVAASLVRLPYGPPPAVPCPAAPFADVPISHVFCVHIYVMSELGIVNGFADGTFRPNSDVTRQGFVAMLVRWIEFLDQ